MDLKLSERNQSFKIIFLGFSGFSLIVTLLLSLGIVYYPGGNIKNYSATKFNFLWNTMCDLGTDIALNGEPNDLSLSLFRGGMFLYIVILIIFFFTLRLFFRERKTSKILSTIGSILIVLSCIFYIGAIYTIGMHPTHNIILAFAPFFEFLAIILYTIIIFKDERFPKLSRYTFLIMSSLSIIYMILVTSGGIVKGDYNLLVQRLGHTIFNFIISSLYVLQGIGAYLFVKRQETFK
jgi:hypothetical protein